jgi:iron complex transport system ATP-binding protein
MTDTLHTAAARGLAVVDATWGYSDTPVIAHLSLRIPAGRITSVIGPNGCGKSTLLMGLARLLPPARGHVLLDGRSLGDYRSKELAQKIALLSQTSTAPDSITVADLVARGRYPHQGALRRWSEEDEAAVIDALTVTSMLDFADRRVAHLSGGQRQRAWIAMTLAQQTPIILLDEPTTFLDLAHQIEVLDLMTDLNRRDERTIVLVLHDLNQAIRYSDHIIALKDGRIAASGAPETIITPALIRDVFDAESHILHDGAAQTPIVVPVGRHHTR